MGNGMLPLSERMRGNALGKNMSPAFQYAREVRALEADRDEWRKVAEGLAAMLVEARSGVCCVARKIDQTLAAFKAKAGVK